MRKKFIIAAAMLSAGLSAQAAVTYIDSDVTTSTTLPALPAGDYYSMTNVVYVMPGASLTLEAGVLFKNSGDGSLGVTRGAQLFVEGTKEAPVIFTGLNDNFSTWQATANQWGSIAILGNGLISASEDDGLPVLNSSGVANTKEPDGYSDNTMEGLESAFVGDTRHYYGGNNDNDDSGSIKYLSVRYGGQQSSKPNKELNGISLGGVGQATEFEYVEVMNNVDDGIEIWGGKVSPKHISIWNIGDDSFDIDQGWRGQAQFGLLVQGYSLVAGQGSGVGDNLFEHDGAEDSDAQPVTTGEIYNFTAIGQPLSGDGATVWRDNCRMQYRNCIFMDIGEELVRFDNVDGDGAQGYGINGTLSWLDTWTTPHTALPSNGTTVAPAALYTAQSEGNFAEITDSIVWDTLTDSGDKYMEVGVTNAANNNVFVSATNELPIVSIVRGPAENISGKIMLPVTSLNPLAANAAVSSTRVAPDNGFYDQAPYVGAFSANHNWLLGWTAADQFGMIDSTGHTAPAATLTLGGVSISFPSQDGIEYTVQSSSEPGFTNAVDVAEITGNGSTMAYVDATLDTAEFYRVILK